MSRGRAAESPLTPPLSIRRARPADAAALTRVAHRAKRRWRYPPAWIRLWAADLTVTATAIAREPTYCAFRGARIVGFWAISGRGPERELEHFWIEPRAIGRGLGRALFTHLLDRLRAMRVERLVVDADPNAEAFYRRMGGRRIGRIPSTPAGRFLPRLLVELRSAGEASLKPAPSRDS